MGFWKHLLDTLGPDERDKPDRGMARNGEKHQVTCGYGEHIPTHHLSLGDDVGSHSVAENLLNGQW